MGKRKFAFDATRLRPHLDRLPGGPFVRSVAVLAGGTALGQAIVILASPALTRLYSPEDFGLLGVYASLLSLVAVIAALRYELAIPLPERDRDAAALAVLCLGIIPVTATSVGLGVWFLGEDIIHWTNFPAFAPYLWLLPVGVASIGIYEVFRHWAVRRKAFGRIAKTKFNQGMAAVSTQLALFLIGPLGLLLGHLASNAVGGSSLGRLAVKEDSPAFRAVDRRTVASMAVRYRRFPQMSAGSGILNSAGLALPTLLLASVFGPFVAGQFSLVHRVVTWPLNLLGGAVAQVYFSEAPDALRTSPSTLLALFLRLTRRLTLIAILPMLVLFVAGPGLFSFVFGHEWSLAGHFARVLAPMVAVQLVASPLSQTLNILELQAWQLGWDAFRLALVIASFSIAVFLDSSPLGTVTAFGASMLIAYLSLWAIQMVAIIRSVNKGPPSPE